MGELAGVTFHAEALGIGRAGEEYIEEESTKRTRVEGGLRGAGLDRLLDSWRRGEGGLVLLICGGWNRFGTVEYTVLMPLLRRKSELERPLGREQRRSGLNRRKHTLHVLWSWSLLAAVSFLGHVVLLRDKVIYDQRRDEDLALGIVHSGRSQIL